MFIHNDTRRYPSGKSPPKLGQAFGAQAATDHGSSDQATSLEVA
ncbi:MAG: hypothetical protein ACP5JG_12795 [Anaerolineae bacterium]